MQLTKLATQLKQHNKEVPQTALVFGDPFTGKTSLVAQFAKKYKLKWIDTDNGYDAIFSALEEKYWGNIDLVRVREKGDTSHAMNTVQKVLAANTPTTTVKISDSTGIVGCVETVKAGGTFTEWNPMQWETDTILVIDSLSRLGDSAMAFYLGGSNGIDFKKKEYGHYDKQGLYLLNILALAQTRPYHVVFITHQEELEQEDGSKKLTPVCGTRNLSTKIGRYFSHAIHCSLKMGKHVVNSQTTGTLNAVAGSRSKQVVKDGESLLKLFELDFSKVPDSPMQINGEADVKDNKTITANQSVK